MAKRKTAADWRVFLRALARTGNARVAAREAGMDVGTAYDHRIKDEAFAARWEAALARAKALAAARLRSGQAGGKKSGEELVVRRSKLHGDQLVRAGAGRWNAGAEETFFAALGRTACVRAAAAACGLSANALYARREAYPEFAEKWSRVLAEAKQRIPDLLAAATIASLDPDPEPAAGRGRLPKINVDQAIRISQMKGPGNCAQADLRDCNGKLRASEEELTAAIVKKLDVLHKRYIRKGWTETEEGHLIPPGWVYVGAGEPGGGEAAA